MPLGISTTSIANAIKVGAKRKPAVRLQLKHVYCSLTQPKLRASDVVRLPLLLKEGVHKPRLPVGSELVSCLLTRLKLLALAEGYLLLLA